MHKFPYNWTLKDAVFTKDKGNVFSCFACGGGSTMGYKLAGFNVLGCNEIDARMAAAYQRNHHPKFLFNEPIQNFKNREVLPDELYNLDILDGSPPCSSFSMAGNRDDDWGKEKKFAEGQAEQILDTLFFDFIDLADRLKQKVVVAENVEGLMMGKARDYVRRIYEAFDKAGYIVQHWLLNAQTMGVPQSRSRVFFIALRKDLCQPFIHRKDLLTWAPYINLDFNEPKIVYSEFADYEGRPITGKITQIAWEARQPGDKSIKDSLMHTNLKPTMFNLAYVYDHKVVSTVTSAGETHLLSFSKKVHMSKVELLKVGSYPQDYDFIGKQYNYLVGMSVPHIMVAQIASRIYDQWLKFLK